MRLRVNLDDIPDYAGPEPGKHRAKLTEVEEDVSSKGNDMWVWHWEVIEGESEGTTIRSYTSLLDNALGGLKTHLKAFGYEGDVDVNTKDLHGRTALLVCSKRKYRDRDTDEEKEGVSVSNVLPDPNAKSGKSSKKASKPVVRRSRDDDEDELEPDDIPF